jgi:hypothetical protein
MVWIISSATAAGMARASTSVLLSVNISAAAKQSTGRMRLPPAMSEYIILSTIFFVSGSADTTDSCKAFSMAGSFSAKYDLRSNSVAALSVLLSAAAASSVLVVAGERESLVLPIVVTAGSCRWIANELTAATWRTKTETNNFIVDWIDALSLCLSRSLASAWVGGLLVEMMGKMDGLMHDELTLFRSGRGGEIPSSVCFVRLESSWWCALPGVLQGRMKLDPKLISAVECIIQVRMQELLILLLHTGVPLPFYRFSFMGKAQLRAKKEMGVWTTSAWRNTGRRLSLYRPSTAPMYGLSRLGSASRGVGRYVAGMTIDEGETT